MANNPLPPNLVHLLSQFMDPNLVRTADVIPIEQLIADTKPDTKQEQDNERETKK
jgi:hypothetical protein